MVSIVSSRSYVIPFLDVLLVICGVAVIDRFMTIWCGCDIHAGMIPPQILRPIRTIGVMIPILDPGRLITGSDFGLSYLDLLPQSCLTASRAQKNSSYNLPSRKLSRPSLPRSREPSTNSQRGQRAS
ncbi:hypothetical protein BDR06DRAFT_656657 [Suillus hirtellus]|nr:hypothetical protein BDR06DRAFT_656657 [Suillus hirtellus]